LKSEVSSSKEIRRRADEPSLIEEFVIEGLYGYRTVGLKSSYAATILISRNGSGKTTLLASLDAFLRAEFGRLNDLAFKKITCRLRGVQDPLILTSQDISLHTLVEEGGEVHKFAIKYGVEPTDLMELMTTEHFGPRRNDRRIMDSEIYKKVLTKAGYDHSETFGLLTNLSNSTRSRSPQVEDVRSRLSEALGDVDIVYLPTYRRIELPLLEEKSPHRSVSVQTRLGISRKRLFSADIKFGLADISERLRLLNNRILVQSGDRYRYITANIINELVDGRYERDNPSAGDLPTKEALIQFFSRIEQSKEVRGRYERDDAQIPNVDRVYDSSGRDPEVDKVLNYFLSKLKVVIDETRGLESEVQSFIDVCNGYLSQRDFSTLDSESNTSFFDDKVLVKDEKTLQVSVQSIALNRKVPLDSLSSGEKQMVSLFGRLYLFPGKKIVLIDEPELSLSIGWQRKILLDVVRAPACAQVVAITHSPFVFDNELEGFAKPLFVSVDLSAQRKITENVDYPPESEEDV
jgi:predicted ATPase